MKVGVASTTPGHLAGSAVQCIFSFKHTLPSLPCCGVPRICLQGACVGFVLCDWDNINCYWNMEGYRIRKLVEALRVSPLPNDATTGIVHCDAPLFLSCYTIPTLLVMPLSLRWILYLHSWDDRRHREKMPQNGAHHSHTQAAGREPNISFFVQKLISFTIEKILLAR